MNWLKKMFDNETFRCLLDGTVPKEKNLELRAEKILKGRKVVIKSRMMKCV